MDLIDSFDKLTDPRILVVGDLMVDRYTYGSTDRTSQEAPVPVLKVERREHRLGGAANVCHMLAELGAVVTCAGTVGQDESGEILRQLLSSTAVDASLLLQLSTRQTTVKERFVGRSGSGVPSQMLRVDCESVAPLPSEAIDKWTDRIDACLRDQQAVVLSDYGKGVLTDELVRHLIAACRQLDIPVLVDPGRDREYDIYAGATLIKPNRHETEYATGLTIDHPDDAVAAGRQLCRQLGVRWSIVTLDAEGMALVESDGSGKVFPTRARGVFDITGAGDMVMAVLALCIAETVAADKAVQIANVAAGLEVDRSGVCTLTREEIRDELTRRAAKSSPATRQLHELETRVEQYRRQGKRIVFTNGCFDLLHIGHVSYLEEAAAQGDILIVGLNSDTSVASLKGPSRPVIGERDRAAMLASLRCVDHVIVFAEPTPHRLLRALRPDVLVKGGTYRPEEVVGREVVESYGGRVYLADVVAGVSTTDILKSLTDSAAPARLKAG